MILLYVTSFLSGTLLGVRLLFFGAGRRIVAGTGRRTSLRIWEPFGISASVLFGVSGYALRARASLSHGLTLIAAVGIAAVGALLVTGLAIATVSSRKIQSPDDARFNLQGLVGTVTLEIPANGVGQIRFEIDGIPSLISARNFLAGGLERGEDVCIERIEEGVAYVERWALVEERL
jgi:hypothetical protein